MKKYLLSMLLVLGSVTVTWAQVQPVINAVAPASAINGESIPPQDLNQFIYSYGTVLKASPTEVVLQEYDYDSDVEKEVTYQVEPGIRLEGIKSTNDLSTDDVIEVYYLEQDGKKVAKIIRKEAADDENLETTQAVESNT